MNIGLNPLVSEMNAGGGYGGGAYVGGPDAEKGRLPMVLDIVGERSIGRVRGKTEADHL